MNAKKTAHHEAGHTLIAWYFGFMISSVTIQPDMGTERDISGYCRAAAPDEGSTDIIIGPSVLSSEKVYFTFAGRVTDDLYFPEQPHGALLDFRNLIAMIPTESTTLEMLKFPREEKTIEDFYLKFKAPVVKILKSSNGKRALKALSAELLKAGTLTGFEAVEIIERAWKKPLPEKAKPAADHMTLKNKGRKTFAGLLQSITTYQEISIRDIENQRFDFSKSENEHLSRIRYQLLLLKLVILNEKRRQ